MLVDRWRALCEDRALEIEMRCEDPWIGSAWAALIDLEQRGSAVRSSSFSFGGSNPPAPDGPPLGADPPDRWVAVAARSQVEPARYTRVAWPTLFDVGVLCSVVGRLTAARELDEVVAVVQRFRHACVLEPLLQAISSAPVTSWTRWNDALRESHMLLSESPLGVGVDIISGALLTPMDGTLDPLTAAIDRVEPLSACGGSEVDVVGSGFGIAQPDGTEVVLHPTVEPFDPMVCEVISWADTVVRIRVPVGATVGCIRFRANGRSVAARLAGLLKDIERGLAAARASSSMPSLPPIVLSGPVDA